VTLIETFALFFALFAGSIIFYEFGRKFIIFYRDITNSIAAFFQRIQKTRAEKRRKAILLRSAIALRQQEAERLAESVVPSVEELRGLSTQRFEDEIARMFKRLGYAVQQTPYSKDRGRDAIMTKSGQTYLLECKRYKKGGLSGRPDLQKFHSAMVSDKATKGFFVTTGSPTQDAKEFAQQVSIELVYGKKLLQFILESKKGVSAEDSYRIMCLECGDCVTHRLQNMAPALCQSGHTVLPTLDYAAIIRIAHPQPIPVCKEHQIPMRLVNGRRGAFWGCPRYPSCRYTRRWHPE
jgi:HJR/Mrr/RecB family endonuclease